MNRNRLVEANDALAFTLIKARFFTAYAGKGGIPREVRFARSLHRREQARSMAGAKMTDRSEHSRFFRVNSNTY
jgi:hypothetical protein